DSVAEVFLFVSFNYLGLFEKGLLLKCSASSQPKEHTRLSTQRKYSRCEILNCI
ncbi:unnamed protein product, partial [Larinioides sclopetarius]